MGDEPWSWKEQGRGQVRPSEFRGVSRGEASGNPDEVPDGRTGPAAARLRRVRAAVATSSPPDPVALLHEATAGAMRDLDRLGTPANDPENLIVLCFAHHRAFHDGWLLIAGGWETGFGFRHVTGKVYGSKDSPSALYDANEVLLALRLYGYPEHDARGVLEDVRPLLESGELTHDDLEDVALRMAGPVTMMRFGLDPAAAHVGNTPTIEEMTALVERVVATNS